MSAKANEKAWQNHAFKIVVGTATHPLEYAKFLIQIGYEPLPPKPGTTFFGKPALKLPNIFQYIKYIKQEDGFIGCYRGLVPKLCGNIASAIASQKVLERFDGRGNDEQNENAVTNEGDRAVYDDVNSDQDKFILSTKRDIVQRFTAIIVSHPFHVVTVRMMAQFVGRETKYSGLLNSVSEIYKENGVLGFFSGLVPKLLGDILSVLIANSLAYLLSTYVFEEEDLKMYATATMSFLATTVTYPFQVVSNCMAVSNSGLMAGVPPYMPNYVSWVDCWSNLSETNQLKRGSSIFIRYYNGPQIIVGGKSIPLTKN